MDVDTGIKNRPGCCILPTRARKRILPTIYIARTGKELAIDAHFDRCMALNIETIVLFNSEEDKKNGLWLVFLGTSTVERLALEQGNDQRHNET